MRRTPVVMNGDPLGSRAKRHAMQSEPLSERRRMRNAQLNEARFMRCRALVICMADGLCVCAPHGRWPRRSPVTPATTAACRFPLASSTINGPEETAETK
ncbi:hypothetical protein MTO96_009129 [Rhipicephalus appendiculatus]